MIPVVVHIHQLLGISIKGKACHEAVLVAKGIAEASRKLAGIAVQILIEEDVGTVNPAVVIAKILRPALIIILQGIDIVAKAINTAVVIAFLCYRVADARIYTPGAHLDGIHADAGTVVGMHTADVILGPVTSLVLQAVGKW